MNICEQLIWADSKGAVIRFRFHLQMGNGFYCPAPDCVFTFLKRLQKMNGLHIHILLVTRHRVNWIFSIFKAAYFFINVDWKITDWSAEDFYLFNELYSKPNLCCSWNSFTSSVMSFPTPWLLRQLSWVLVASHARFIFSYYPYCVVQWFQCVIGFRLIFLRRESKMCLCPKP